MPWTTRQWCEHRGTALLSSDRSLLCSLLAPLAVMQVATSKQKLQASMVKDAYPLDYQTVMRVLRDALAVVKPEPVVVSEGANTMDNAR